MAFRWGVRSPPRPPGENIMKKSEMEAKLHKMTQLALELDLERRAQSHERARARVMRRDDVASCEIREDGTLLCTDHEGRQVLRAAGWRGRS